jgi:undecaprenyl-diphosphatase
VTQPGHHHPQLFEKRRWAIAGSVTLYLAALFILAWVALDRSSIQGIDDQWFDAMVAIEAGALTWSAKIFNLVGSAWITLPIRLGLSAFLWTRKRWEQLAAWLATWAVSDVAIGALKALYERPRPPDALVGTTNFSFPSGHAMAGAATAVAIVIVFLPAGAHRRIWEVAAGIFAFLMALSRTYLRAHWLSDVVAGALLGTATAIGVAAIAHLWWLQKRAPRADAPDG